MSISLQILLFLAVVLALAVILGGLCVRMGLPAVLGELLAGVILGPSALDLYRFHVLFPGALSGHAPIAEAVRVLAQVGVVVLMFVAGAETDQALLKAAFRPALTAATGGVLLPLAGGTLVARAFGMGWAESVFIGTILTATSVSVTARTLKDLGQLQSRAGSTILGAAVIDDVLGLLVLSMVMVISSRGAGAASSGWMGLAATLAGALLFLAGSFWIGRRVIRWAIAREYVVPHARLATALACAFVFAYLAERVGGMAAITGAFMAGLGTSGTPEGRRITLDLGPITGSFFGPLFFASIGLEINAWELRGQTGFFILILLIAMLGKVFGCGAAARWMGLSRRESLTVGVGMIPRGEVGLITASIGWAAGMISPSVFALVVVLVLASTLVTPFLLGLIVRKSERGGPRPSETEVEAAREEKTEGDEAWSPFPRWLRARAGSLRLFAVLLLTVAAVPACAMKKIAINKIGDAIAQSGAVYSSDNDPELVREAVPFGLKLYESLLADSPKHRGLLLAAAKGFTEYGYAFVQEDADELESRDLESANRMHGRARLLYLRARDYGLRSLEVRHRGFGNALRENPKAAVERIRSRKEVPLLYWTAASWGLAISVSKDQPDLVADQPIVEALIDRGLALDERFDEGAIHSFLISYEPSRQGAKGDPLERSREHFRRAVELSHGKLAGPYVALAETVDVQKQDRAEFEMMLHNALAINPDAQPNTRLENLVGQQRARWLLARTDELFAE